ncbi:MAG: hypothetical protein K0R51_3152 [Cytophagaceae bacterium]|jgi:hypothetical protein|nr:hypothetical protein [Cytophagaceae bacterium]
MKKSRITAREISLINRFLSPLNIRLRINIFQLQCRGIYLNILLIYYKSLVKLKGLDNPDVPLINSIK